MSDLLRRHVQDFGFSSSEIAQRANTLNPATAWRVVEGDTANPSLNSITSIVEAICLTDADAGVLYRKLGIDHARPRCYALPSGVTNHHSARQLAKDQLDRGEIRAAAQSVMAMFDLAEDDEQLSQAYEQAGIVYMGMGRWEEAQVNFEAADAHLNCDTEDPNLSQKLLDRKHTLMTNIGSLMVKRGNTSWSMLFARSVITHPRVSLLNQGWAKIVLGEAELTLNLPKNALKSYQQARACFEQDLTEAKANDRLSPGELQRINNQIAGNLRWTDVHIARCQQLSGHRNIKIRLQKMATDWRRIDPESAETAAFFIAEQHPHPRQRQQMLRDLRTSAKRHGLGELLLRIAAVLSVCFVMLRLNTAPATPITAPKIQAELHRSKALSRGNTGRGRWSSSKKA